MTDVTSAAIYAYLDAGWTNITADQVGNLSADWGISGTSPLDLLADTGTIQFSLDNRGGEYTPGGASVTAGWKKGIQIKIEFVYADDTYIRFIGTLDAIDLAFDVMGLDLANVTVVDWINYAAVHPILTPALQADKRADEAINSIVDAMPIQPAGSSLDAGINTFPYVFDLVRKKSKALTELSMIANSEYGHIYLQKDQGSGELLVLENAQHRNGLHAWSTVPLVTTDALLMETGDHLLKEDGGKILLNKVQTIAFADGMRAMNVSHGDDLANRVTVTAYPRRVDVNLAILYTLGSPMRIGNGETREFTASYTDPSGGNVVGGFGMLNPVITTDYLVNTLEDGTGTNLSTSAIVSVTFGGNSAAVVFQNTSTSSGYITFFQLRGYGVYTYDTAGYAIENTLSIDEYGYFERTIDQKYQGSLEYGEGVAKTNLYLDSNPRTILQSFTFLANKSADNMICFLNLDIGSLIQVSETGSGISGTYFIQNISFTIQPKNIIWVTYELVEHWSLLTSTMTSLEMEFYISGKRGAINYGYLPQVVQTSARSYAAWVYHDTSTDGAVIAGPFSDGGGVLVHVSSLDRVRVYSNLFNTNPGWWHSPSDSLDPGAWRHIVVTFDCWDVDAVPVIYIDSVSQLVTETDTPAGTLNSEYGAEVVVGNWRSDTQDYSKTWDGHLKDVRIYNKILTSTEVTTLYNAGVCAPLLVTDGLVFQSQVVRSNDIALYDGVYLYDGLQVLDNIYKAVGTPFGISLATAI